MAREKGRAKYSTALPEKMYSYFNSFQSPGAPSFNKFARSIGVTVGDLERFRKHREFEEAWRECGEIRRDYLIDCALTKRHDSSFSKFIIQYEEDAEGLSDENDGISVTLEVIEK